VGPIRGNSAFPAHAGLNRNFKIMFRWRVPVPREDRLIDGHAGAVRHFGGTILTGSLDEFGKFIAKDTEKWAKVVKFSDAKPV
jgi:hypothetical protein